MGRPADLGRVIRGRWAPSPTGAVHLGNARTALVAWLSVRAQGGRFLWRVEDLDQPRVVAGRAAEQALDIAWLGLDWDEGPWHESSKLESAEGGRWLEQPGSEYWQSCRDDFYRQALRQLADHQRVFPCSRSRRELQNIASAPHGKLAPGSNVPANSTPASSPYPAELRPKALKLGWLEEVLAQQGATRDAVRLRLDSEQITFVDRVFGEQQEDPALTVGDYVLRRRDGVWAYQLAVVVDDAAHGVSEVVRGADLLDSTARQISLQRALGLATPAYAHVPLLLNTAGDKLNKRDGALELSALRESGVAAAQVVGYLAWTLGLIDDLRPCSATALVERFAWHRIGQQPTVVPADVASVLLGMRPE